MHVENNRTHPNWTQKGDFLIRRLRFAKSEIDLFTLVRSGEKLLAVVHVVDLGETNKNSQMVKDPISVGTMIFLLLKHIEHAKNKAN